MSTHNLCLNQMTKNKIKNSKTKIFSLEIFSLTCSLENYTVYCIGMLME